MIKCNNAAGNAVDTLLYRADYCIGLGNASIVLDGD